MTTDPGHEHPSEPDRVDDWEDRRERLEAVADVNARRRGWPQAQVKAQVTEVKRTVLAMSRRDAVARADSISSGEQNPSIAVADPADAGAYDSLRAKAQSSVTRAPLQRRQGTRQLHVARDMSFVDPSGSFETTDAVVAALGTVADSPDIRTTGDLAAAANMLMTWRGDDPSRIVADLQIEHSETYVDRADLDVHVARLHAVEKFSPAADFIWDNGAAILDSVGHVIQAQPPEGPVDLGALIERAAQLEADGSSLPPAVVAQIGALACGALHEDSTGRRASAPDPTLMSLAERFNLSQAATLESVRGAEAPVRRGTALRAARPARIAVASEADLSVTWDRWQQRAVAELRGLPDGQQRIESLTIALPAAVSDALREWSRARARDASVQELSEAARAVQSALESARAALLKGLGNLEDLQGLSSRNVEARLLTELLGGYGAEFTRQVRAAARGEGPRGSRLDGVRAMIEMETARAQVLTGEAPELEASSFNSTLGREPWAVELQKALNSWRTHRVQFTDERRWKNLYSDAMQFMAAVVEARSIIAQLGTHDRREWTKRVDATLMSMATFLRGVRAAGDRGLPEEAFSTLVDQLENAIPAPETTTDPVTTWTTRSSALMGRLRDAHVPLPDFMAQLGPALMDWRDARAVSPPQPDRLEAAALGVLDALHSYRVEARQVTDPDIAAEYEELFDLIAASVAAGLTGS